MLWRNTNKVQKWKRKKIRTSSTTWKILTENDPELIDFKFLISITSYHIPIQDDYRPIVIIQVEKNAEQLPSKNGVFSGCTNIVSGIFISGRLYC